jgi:AcrR family transcriptional regulator
MATLPVSERGRRTRAALLQAARDVFERDGFLDAKISDISAEAGVATGSFYTYFDDKDDIFAAVLADVEERMLHPGVHLAHAAGGDPAALIEDANRAYLTAYREHAQLMKLLEQVATIDEGFRALRRQRSEAFVRRNTRAIRRLQREGVADANLDAATAALALSSMVSRTAYSVYVLETHTIAFEDLVATLTRMWVNALGIRNA